MDGGGDRESAAGFFSKDKVESKVDVDRLPFGEQDGNASCGNTVRYGAWISVLGKPVVVKAVMPAPNCCADSVCATADRVMAVAASRGHTVFTWAA